MEKGEVSYYSLHLGHEGEGGDKSCLDVDIVEVAMESVGNEAADTS